MGRSHHTCGRTDRLPSDAKPRHTNLRHRSAAGRRAAEPAARLCKVGGMTSALIPREEYVALERCVYLNQASLGLIPRRSTEAMVEFLVGVAQYGNVRLSDVDEERMLDELREAAAGLFDAPLRSVAGAGGAREAVG